MWEAGHITKEGKVSLFAGLLREAYVYLHERPVPLVPRPEERRRAGPSSVCSRPFSLVLLYDKASFCAAIPCEGAWLITPQKCLKRKYGEHLRPLKGEGSCRGQRSEGRKPSGSNYIFIFRFSIVIIIISIASFIITTIVVTIIIIMIVVLFIVLAILLL